MNKKTIKLEVENENAFFGGYFYEALALPATTHEIRDVMNRVRMLDEKPYASQLSVYDCDLIPQLTECRLDSPSIDELNFLAKRLTELNEDEVAVMQAVIPRFIKGDEEEIVSVKDLINMTYGLSSVSVISNVSSDKQLGVFVIENDLHGDVENIPYNSRYLLDKEAIGRMQRAADDGVFVGDKYIVTCDFELPKIYDGITLPESTPEKWYAFRLLVSDTPQDDNPTIENAEWISLPITDSDMAVVAHRHNASSLDECVFYDFESSIPQITDEDFTTMDDIFKLNDLAKYMAEMSPHEQLTFKAALEAEKPNGTTFKDICNISQNLHRYEMSTICNTASDFFKEYLLTHMDSKFDEKWLDSLECNREGQKLLSRLGATLTEYGVISARNGSLYQIVPVEDQSEAPAEGIEEDEGMNMTM